MSKCFSNFVVDTSRSRLLRQVDNVFGSSIPDGVSVDSGKNVRHQTHALDSISKLAGSRWLIQITTTVSRYAFNGVKDRTARKELNDPPVSPGCLSIKKLLERRRTDQTMA